jgi:hypothetical protein
MSHRISAAALTALLLVSLSSPGAALAYSVVLRWTGSSDPVVQGYHVLVRTVGGDERAPIDVARPRRDGAGNYEATIGDLDVTTTYAFAMSAYDAAGREIARSNERTIGYAEAAAVVDSDHDGRTDADEDRNLNLRRDAGETDRSVADTDGDLVPDGLEVAYGGDPLTAGSPACAPLDFDDFRVSGRGTATVGYDAELDDLALATTARGKRSTAIGVGYPQKGKAALASPLLVTRLRSNAPFRIEIQARSTAGKVYRLRYDGHGKGTRVSKRRLQRDLGHYFTGERYESIGIDVAAEIAAMDPGAVFASIERISVRGDLVMQRLHVCR